MKSTENWRFSFHPFTILMRRYFGLMLVSPTLFSALFIHNKDNVLSMAQKMLTKRAVDTIKIESFVFTFDTKHLYLSSRFSISLNLNSISINFQWATCVCARAYLWVQSMIELNIYGKFKCCGKCDLIQLMRNTQPLISTFKIHLPVPSDSIIYGKILRKFVIFGLFLFVSSFVNLFFFCVIWKAVPQAPNFYASKCGEF